MNQTSEVASLIDDYFSLAYDPTSRKFDNIFHSQCLIQWLHNGSLESMTAESYRSLIYGRPSPMSIDAPRDEGIVDINHISRHLSAVTARVRIGNNSFVDHLILHEIDKKWLITNKSSFIACSRSSTS
ncbi:nuclear transport factor 2 family protein [Trinickia acidisoli]|uniref:nuclear transport factor 2 family protein n=1 Tax=Trinickia acidisoli TaxID=2767482 RepID=UPI001A8E0BD5|nr:nuclear transport factor 2 family protein [Trinickia acidisoli]